MGLPKSFTAGYSPEEIAEIIKLHIKREGFDVVGEVSFVISNESVGFGPNEHDEAVFKGANVNIKPIDRNGMNQLELAGH